MTGDGDGVLPWAVVAGLVAVVVAVAAVRVVAAHERLVVLRLGRAVRLAGPGVATLLPGLERAVRVSLREQRLDRLGIRASTRDGVVVWVSVTARYRVVDPERSCTAASSASAATAEAVEAAVHREVSRSDLVDLVGGSAQRTARVLRDADGAAAAWGAEVIDVEITDVDLQLTAELLHWAERVRPARTT